MFIETPCTLYMNHRPEIITVECTYVIQSKSPFKELQARFLTVPLKESDRLCMVVQLLYIAGYSL